MSKKLYVGNLPFEFDDNQLKELFSQAGEIESAEVVRDKATDRSKGFGFVIMSSAEEAEKAVNDLNGHEVDGRSLTVSEARPVSPKLYIGNLPYSVDDSYLTNLFGQAGQVVSASVIKDKLSNNSKGFGFVEMSSSEEAEKAIEQFNGYEVEGRALRVSQAKPMEARSEGGGNNRFFDRRDSYSRR